MSVVKEVADAIKIIGDVVKSTREMINAVNDGKKFLASRYPQTKKDFSDLIEQMRTAVQGLAEVTKVLSGFRFVVAPPSDATGTAQRELARFNEHVIAQRGKIDSLRNEIRKLKADCQKVEALRQKLDASSETPGWGTMFGLLGAKAKERSAEMVSNLHSFYGSDEHMIDLIRSMLALAESGMREVQAQLGPPGMADPANLALAARMLGVYAVAFDEPYRQLNELADELSDARTDLLGDPA